MSVLNDIQYYDDVYKIYGFYSTNETGVGIIRSCARLGYTKKTLRKMYNRTNVNRKTAILANTLTLLGYIPGIGIITGILKISTLGNHHKQESSSGQRNEISSSVQGNHKLISRGIIIKGLLEICGIGLLCAPTDIYISYKRKQNPISAEEVIARGTDEPPE